MGLRNQTGRWLVEEDARSVGLTLLAAAIGAILVLPIAWFIADAVTFGEDAFELLTAESTLRVLLTSIELVAVVTAGSIAIGVPLAVLTAQTDLPFSRFFTVISALPLAVPSYLGAFAALSATGPRGALTEALAPLGVPVPEITGFAGAAIVLTLYTYPYVFLTTRASLLSLDGSLVAAARTLDCGRWEAFRRVTLPQIIPGIAAGALLVALYTLSDFGTPNFMGVGVFTQVIWSRYDGILQSDVALLSLQLLAVTVVILAVESRIGADDAGAYASRGNRGGANAQLGAWRYPAMLLPAAVAAIAVLTPIVVFGLLWLQGGGVGYDTAVPQFTWSYGVNSTYVALFAAVAGVVIAIPVAFQSASSDSRVAALADRASYIGYAVPGIVIGIALLGSSLEFSSLELTPVVYKTIPLLVFAYVVRFVPQAIGSIRASTMQVDRRLTDAARTLGRSPLSTFRHVTLPLIAPGIASGAALIFLTTVKELPATLLLRPLGFDTLVTYIWRVRETGAYGQAAIPALALVVVSALSMAVILRTENT
jgi:iron(III) transport system permease protein